MKFSFKNSLRTAALGLSTILVSSSASAHIKLEPYAGYNVTGTLSDASGTSLGTYTGFTVGARLVVPLGNVLFFGADGSYAPGYNYTDSSSNPGTNVTATRVGAVLGLDVPGPFRLWGGYNFMDSFAASGSTYTGTSLKGGLGIKLGRVVSVQGEYINSTYSNGSGNTILTALAFSI